MKIDWHSIRKDLCLNSISEVYFWKSNWEKFDPQNESTTISNGYVFYRLVFMLLFIFSMFGTLCTSHMIGGGYFLLYLTSQVYFLQMTYSVIYFFYILHNFVYQRKAKEKPTVTCKILWILMSLLQVGPYIVTFGFWMVLVIPKENRSFSTFLLVNFCDHFQNFLIHAFNSVEALVDSLVISVPSRLVHCLFVVAYAILYGLFTFVYEKSSGKYPRNNTFIYPILDWRKKPGVAAGAVVTATVATTLTYFVFSYGIYRLRIRLRKKCVLQGEEEEEAQPSETPQTEADNSLAQVKTKKDLKTVNSQSSRKVHVETKK